MAPRVGRSEEDLISALSTPVETSERIADLVKRLRPDQLRRLLAMTPSDRLDRAFALIEFAHDAGTARILRE